jgi:glycosyltransferase involved in cell wall biosynthesis
MRVCLDIQSAVLQRAGVGRYTYRLAQHLGAMRGSDELTFFHFDFNRRGSPDFGPGSRVNACRWIPGRAAQGAWKMINFPPFNWFSGSADVFHFPNFIRPPVSRGATVVTIHDLAFLRMPETIEAANYRHLTRNIRRTVERADAVIAVSEFTAREIRELLDVPADRVVPIHSGVDPVPRAPHETEIVATRRMLGLERPYLLALSTLEPRKNYPFLVEVFEALTKFDGDLVIAGGRGWKFDPILDRIRRSPKAARIRYLEYVQDALLPGLYAGAELFVFPSLYEGFGFTPLEAMAHGIPVVSSAGGSLPEVLDGAALIMEDFVAESWAREIERLLADSSRRTAHRAAGFELVKSYSWAETARRTWDVYRRLA